MHTYILGLDKNGARIATYLQGLHFETAEECIEEILKLDGVVDTETLTEEEYKNYVDTLIQIEDTIEEEDAADEVEIDTVNLLEIVAELYERLEGIENADIDE